MVRFVSERSINILVADDPGDWVRGFVRDLYLGPVKMVAPNRRMPVRQRDGFPAGAVRMFLSGSEEESFEIVRRERLDLALVAGDNPRLGGLSLVRRMHLLSAELPVIVLGSQTNLRWLREALDVGVKTVLPRPVNVGQLVSLSVKILGG